MWKDKFQISGTETILESVKVEHYCALEGLIVLLTILMLLEAAFDVLHRQPLRRLPVTSSVTAISATFSAT